MFPAGHFSKEGTAVPSNKPNGSVTLLDIHHYIMSERARKVTEELRAEVDPDKQRTMKVLNFAYCTPYGTFSYRNSKGLQSRSGLIVLDFDHIEDPVKLASLKEALKHDRHHPAQLLFTSPRGQGLKDFIFVGNVEPKDLPREFQRIALHMAFEYGYDIDQSGKDVTRSCFLCYDPDCYISPDYLFNNSNLPANG